jgi:peptide/nickel transport system substrate-binding protein
LPNSLRHVRFDAWKSGPLPQLQRVIVREVPSAANRRALLERGDADISFDLPPKDFYELSQAGKLRVIGVPIENALWYVGMNVTKPPFDNVQVRQAVASALPYDKIMKAAFYGRASSAVVLSLLVGIFLGAWAGFYGG